MTPARQEARTLRAAAAWLQLAADRLETGQIDERTADYAALGEFGAQGSPERIRALFAQVSA